MLNVFTDGACAHNGRANAKASWAIVFPDRPDLDDSGLLEDQHTNNRAEFTAAIKALEKTNGPIHIYSDSMLLIKIATHEWRAKLNTDLVKRLHDLTREREVGWTHVRAHTGKTDWASKWNAEVDRRANRLVEN